MGRLQDYPAARREGGQNGSRGDGDREVPRWRDDGQSGRHEERTRDAVKVERAFRVVVREIGRLADLDVALGNCLAGLARHDFDEPAAIGGEHIPRVVEDACAIR